VLRAALQIAEKAVNAFADSIQRGAILIVCQSANAKYSQDCFLSASRFSTFLCDRNGVTGKSGSTGACESVPGYLIFDRATNFEVVETMKDFGITPKRTSFRSPWQNGVAERWVGNCRRDLLDHVIV
jgi:hypothetical protein